MCKETDVFVIGGGPAGLAAAIAARQCGFDVIVADGARPPIDKPCGEGLLPDGRVALSRLGIYIPADESHAFHGIRFVSGGVTVDANFPDGTGTGIRRRALHRLMISRAEAAGVSLLWQTPVTSLHQYGVRLGNEIARSRWIIGADGGNSLVRRWAGLEASSGQTRFAFRRHYRIAPWSDFMQVHWGPRCQIYITPVAADEICIALVSHDPHLRLDAALPHFPDIVSRLSNATASSVERGAISSTRKLRYVYRGRIALVGVRWKP
jgi:menaquinone-9 beta-reductase